MRHSGKGFMNYKALFERSRTFNTVDRIHRDQLLWMLLLRIILYTLLLGLNFFFRGSDLDILLMPHELLALLLMAVYLSTIASAISLVFFQVNLRIFGFLQTLLDTVFASLLVYATGASDSIFTSVYFFPIIAGGLILPRKGGLIAAAASTLEYGFVLVLELFGYSPHYLFEYGFEATSDPLVSLNHFAVLGLTFFLAAILAALFSLRIKTTENALSDSLRNYDQLAVLYKQIFDNIATGIITINNDGRITSVNNATRDITGYPIAKLVGRMFEDHFPQLNLSAPRMRQSANFLRQEGQTIRLGYSHVNLESASPSEEGVQEKQKIITLRDISEIEQLEAQMRQAEKLAAIGMMSASIAHDFRNPLTAISGSAQVLANEFSSDGIENHENYELVDIILRESNRMISTISDFLKFSRPDSVDRAWFSLKSCLDEVIQVCRADPAWPGTAHIRVMFDETLDIWADQRQIHTVLNHLIQNGMAFCPPGNEIIDIKAEELRDKVHGDTIRISVSDNGPGVASENREKIFEPFFTSRADGTGLGLAIVRQIIEEHGGAISLRQDTISGAMFIVVLPLPS